VSFYYLTAFQHWSGNYNATWTSETTPQSTIQWYYSDLWILSSAFASSGPLYFYSDYQNSETGYSSSHVSVVDFGAAGITIENAEFDGVNIVFDYDGTLYDCNFTDNAFINSTSATTATISGNSIFADETYLSCLTAGVTFQVVIDQPSTVTMTDTFGIFGNVVFVNSGTFNFNSNAELYFDANSFWVNMGLMRVYGYSNDYIVGSTFPGSGTGTGTLVNMGTIQFESSGGLNWEAGTGEFYQSNSGVLKYIYGVGADPYYPQFADIALDGYIGIYFASGYTPSTTGITLFTWKASDYTSDPQNIWAGDITVSTNDNAHTIPSPQQSCYDPTGGYAYLYPISGGLCSSQSSGYVTFSNPSPTGGVVSAITNPTVTALLAQTPPCGAHSANTNCGQNVGISTNNPSTGSGSIIPVSISFLMSCLAYLYFSTF